MKLPADHIVRIMRERGFAPSARQNVHYIEFTKQYFDRETGRHARAIVQFDRPGPAGGELRLSGFDVLVQAHVAATVDAVEERAPPVMREDLMSVVAAFDPSADPPPPTVVTETCIACRRSISEFFVVRGDVLCRTCKEA